jgi:Rho termination factor, N-terminal domain
MTNATFSATLTAADTLLNGIDSTARFALKATRYTVKAARAAWPVIKIAAMLMLAIAIFLGFKTYEMGGSFRLWCDRLVEQSLEVRIAGYLMPAPEKADDMPAPSSEEILAEWQEKAAHMVTVVEYAETNHVPDWYKEAVAQAVDALNAVEEFRQVEAWTELSGYTIRELKKMASKAKIKGYPKMSKAELIKTLAAA